MLHVSEESLLKLVDHIEKHRISIVRWGETGNQYLWPLMPGLGLYAALVMNLVLIVAWILK